MEAKHETLEKVRDYYGRVLRGSSDLKTTACCAAEKPPHHIAKIVDQIHPEVRERFYGCGVIAPEVLEGCTILDLGCGTGLDAVVLAKLAGPRGKVIGLDMTEAQLAIGRRHLEYHAKTFHHQAANITLLQGYIENLEAAEIASESIDVVVSNCVINLSPAKERVFSEIFRVLRPGGELFFSDVFSDRRLPQVLTEDPVLLGECLGGAMYLEDFRRLMTKVGFADVRTLSRSKIGITSPEISLKVGCAQFLSLTLRAFKLNLEDRCEDYGQIAWYRGTIPESPLSYRLDDHHWFEAHRPLPVCSNTAKMLVETRLAPHFTVDGDLSRHFGLFSCAPIGTSQPTPSDSCC